MPDAFEDDHRKDAVGVLFVRGGPVGDLGVEPVTFGALLDDGIRLVGGVSDLDDDRRVRAEIVEPRGVLWGTGLGCDDEHPAVVDRVAQGDGAGPARPSPGGRQQQDREGRLTHGAMVGPELINDAPVVGQELRIGRHLGHKPLQDLSERLTLRRKGLSKRSILTSETAHISWPALSGPVNRAGLRKVRHDDPVRSVRRSLKEDPRPVMVVNDHGLTLGVDSAGTWLIWDQHHAASPARDRLLWLLPLLERPPDVVVPGIAALDAGGELMSALVRSALGSASQYWTSMALRWLEAGYPVGEFANILAVLKDSPLQTQPVRHRALTLWRKAVSIC